MNLYHDFTPTNVWHYTVSDQNQMSPVYLFIQIQILIDPIDLWQNTANKKIKVYGTN